MKGFFFHRGTALIMFAKIPDEVWLLGQKQFVTVDHLMPEYLLRPNGQLNSRHTFTNPQDLKQFFKAYSEYAYTQVNSRKCGLINTKTKRCLGNIICQSLGCCATVRPRVDETEEKIESLTCSVCLGSALKWVKCDCVLRIDCYGFYISTN